VFVVGKVARPGGNNNFLGIHAEIKVRKLVVLILMSRKLTGLKKVWKASR